MRILAVFFCMLVVAMPVQAQTRACTEMGCTNGVSFSVNPNYDWKNGAYDVQVALGLRTVECRGELPLNPCEQGPTFSCDDSRVQIIESGCALPEENHRIDGIRISDNPNKILIRVARNYKTIVTRTVIPNYQMVMPNGPGCGPVCRNAGPFDLIHAGSQ